MASPPDAAPKPQEALRRILTRQAMRLWASKATQERAHLAERLLQLFSSSGQNAVASTAADLAARPITRRPGVEEVKGCVLSSVYPCLPPQCDALRGEIWQVLLNVYRRNQHGSAAQEFDRMLQRLGKLPRDPLLCDECGDVAEILEPTDAKARERVQQELEVLLMWFLTTKSVAYSTGMARVVAPFFLLKMPLPTIYDCFYQYCAHFLPHFVVADSLFADAPGLGGGLGSNRGSSSSMDEAYAASRSSGLQRSSSMDSTSSLAEESKRRADEEEAQALRRERQQLVEQLLSYHAPQLAHLLNQWCGNEWSVAGKLFAADFLLGHLYQVVPPAAFVHVMDQYLLTGDSLFGIFFVIAALIQREDELTSCGSTEQVQEQIRTTFAATAFEDQENVRFLCLLASRLRSKTPKTYKCSQREATAEIRCSSREAIEIAYGSGAGMAAKMVRAQSNNGSLSGPPSSGSLSGPPSSDRKSTAEAAVDMSQWVMKESRSIAGKIFWYHTQTGKTQWEHPAEKHDPPSAYFALPVSVEEVGPQLMGGGDKSSDQQQTGTSSLRFFVVDCRGLRSSEDLKSGRIPVAYTLDPSVFDSPELIAKSMEAFNPMKSQVHVVLVGHGVGIPPELVTSEDVKTSIRDAVRLDTDCLNQAALFFQKRGFRFVSTLDGGYSSWHAFMRDRAGSSPQELLNHVAGECVYCRYDTILRTGEDPLKQKSKQKKPRRKKAMPTMTSMPVNGGEGDASIISTSEINRASSTSVGSNTGGSTLGRRQLSLSRSSITSMRSKLSEVSIPKKWGWRRRSSTNTSQQNDSGSSSEAATAEDGGSDHGSSTDDLEEKQDEATHEMLRAALEEPEDPHVTAGADGADTTKDSKFVGVFTIDYSDDEDEDNNEEPSTDNTVADSVPKSAEPETAHAVVGSDADPTASA
ncbi:hypothetical protein PF008_g19556 [Phytophthora fragariae]|uniref:TBC1 domain family member 23 n=1 Tax=Phytophthora fragariae TaxID=53985 RepID=A0A6G0R3B7_9STRA|nr:hypothetical protein PF008_g19556 [Phytophthora fragariae]